MGRDKPDLKRLIAELERKISAFDARLSAYAARMAATQKAADEMRKARDAMLAAMGAVEGEDRAIGSRLRNAAAGIAPPMRTPEEHAAAYGANGAGATHPPQRKRNYRYRPLEGGELTKESVIRFRELVANAPAIDRLILALKAHPEGLSDEELQGRIGVTGLSGITGATSKNAVKAGIGKEFITRKRAMIGDRVGWRFSLTPEFRGLMDEIGWRERVKRTPV